LRAVAELRAQARPAPAALAERASQGLSGDVRLDGRAHLHVEGLTAHGRMKFNDADSIVVRGCTIETTAEGIVSYGSGVKNAYITDNVIRGPTVWNEAALGASGDNLGEGVQLTGPGNVVAFNRVSGFRDCLSLLEVSEAVLQISNDFYGNDPSECADDAIEADFAMGNVRVYANRITNSFIGLSSQPSLGGPTYFLRNVLYNVVFQAFKLQRTSIGDVGFHNTVVKSGDAFSVRTDIADFARPVSQQLIFWRPRRDVQRLRLRPWQRDPLAQRGYELFLRLRRLRIDWPRCFRRSRGRHQLREHRRAPGEHDGGARRAARLLDLCRDRRLPGGSVRAARRACVDSDRGRRSGGSRPHAGERQRRVCETGARSRCLRAR
jgi:hypothetical protein